MGFIRFFRKGRICYNKSVCSPLDYIYNLGYNGINRVDKLLDISEFDEENKIEKSYKIDGLSCKGDC